MATPQPPPADGRADLEARVRLVTSIVAPTTVLTALLFYYGYVATAAQYRYFGVTLGSLNFSYQDFLMASVAAVYVPLGVLLVLAVLLLWGHAAMAPRLAAAAGPHRRLIALTLLLLGLLLFGRGVLGVVLPDVARSEPIALTPTCLGLGIGCVAYGRRVLVGPGQGTQGPGVPGSSRPPWTETTSSAVVIGFVVVALFWAANSFAAAYGTGRGEVIAQRLDQRPAVVLDTTDRLHLAYTGVEEQQLPTSGDEGYRFRYRGLRLLVESGGRLFLLPESWTPSTGAAVVVPVGDEARVQFYRTS